ncbi:MAG TPA: zinc ribbon domain-containing protein [Candidatus Dependentiae bacterium]|nr:zinc ribbon domain-containing protein [Candidatus Dependentiae bacterium]
MRNDLNTQGYHFLYRGLIRCAQCGLAISPERHKGYVYYHCTEYNGKHGAKWIREEKITEELSNIFKRLQLPLDMFKQIQDTLTEVHHNKMAFQNKQFDELTMEQKNITLMIDNLYLDKLKGKISEERYDTIYASLNQQMEEINVRLARLQAADKDYYLTAKYILEISSKAHDLFMSSEVEGKRHLIKLVLSNLKLDGEKLVYDAHKPFDLLLKCSDDLIWRP